MKDPDVHFTLLQSTAVPAGSMAAKDLKALAVFALSRQGIGGPVELTVDLTGPRRIQALNRRFRGVDRTTDVISFRNDVIAGRPALPQFPIARGPASCAGHGGLPLLAGDIAINVHQAALQAKTMGHSARREVRLLLIHGILHLLGFTDYAPRPRRRMFKRQNALLRSWERIAP